jgi:hypothetical protein
MRFAGQSISYLDFWPSEPPPADVYAEAILSIAAYGFGTKNVGAMSGSISKLRFSATVIFR